MRVAADRDVCISSGMCMLTAPGAFDQDDEGIVALLTENVGPADAEMAHRAVASG